MELKTLNFTGTVLSTETNAPKDDTSSQHLRGKHQNSLDESGSHRREHYSQQLYIAGASMLFIRCVPGFPSSFFSGDGRPRTNPQELQ